VLVTLQHFHLMTFFSLIRFCISCYKWHFNYYFPSRTSLFLKSFVQKLDYLSDRIFFSFYCVYACVVHFRGFALWMQGRSRGRPGAQPSPSIDLLFQVFRLNFSWDMSKMHYFNIKFSKVAKRWELSAPSAT